MIKRILFLLIVLTSSTVIGGPIPGFRIEKITSVEGFITSLAFRDQSRLYWSSATGEVFELSGSVSEKVAYFETAVEGNAVLLGITFRGDEMFAHYVAKDLSADVVESLHLETGERKIIANLVCDKARPCPSEHHGGNLTTAPDGAIYFGVGDYGTHVAAQDPQSPGGKIYRITPDNSLQLFAKGFRNPYDMVFDPSSGKLIVADNGPTGGDEVNFVSEGENHGWPLTFGHGAPAPGMVAPSLVFDETVAPTGMLLLPAGRSFLDGGILLATYWDKSLFWIRTTGGVMSAPVRLLDTGEREDGGAHKVEPQHEVPLLADSLIDVVQDRHGTIFFATTTAIYRLRTPFAGDVDGNGTIDNADADALGREILDGGPHSYLEAGGGAFPASWGADVNRDGVIDARDLVALTQLRAPRKRPVSGNR